MIRVVAALFWVTLLIPFLLGAAFFRRWLSSVPVRKSCEFLIKCDKLYNLCWMWSVLNMACLGAPRTLPSVHHVLYVNDVLSSKGNGLISLCWISTNLVSIINPFFLYYILIYHMAVSGMQPVFVTITCFLALHCVNWKQWWLYLDHTTLFLDEPSQLVHSGHSEIVLLVTPVTDD